MNPAIRLRRLYADYEKMRRLGSESERISFACSGCPPDEYVVTYRCKGLVLKGNALAISGIHRTQFILHSEYPDVAPYLKQLTPIFHPNFNGSSICINDRDWAPAECLADLVLRIGNMIIYRNYNPDSPLNPTAAAWARDNRRFFPIDTRSWLINSDKIVTITSGGDGNAECGIEVLGDWEDGYDGCGEGVDEECTPDEPDIDIRVL